MNLRKIAGWSCVLCLSAFLAQAQDAAQTDQLEKKLKEMQDSFDKQQREMRESFERMLKQQQEQIDALKKQIAAATNAPAISTPATNQEAMQAQIDELNEKTDVLIETAKKVRPNEFNPSIGL